VAARDRLERHAPPLASGEAIPAGNPESAREAIEAVARLPRRQREVVLLHVWADLSYEQIARALNIPIGTVRSRLNRARGALGADPSLVQEPSRA
jgi:RNA polymerase sigma-70 factor (ECF subfamily)